jgi:hypothetical protein
MDAIGARLETLAPDAWGGQEVILVAFVHGGKHNARSDDDNLSAFRVLLKETVDYEKAASATSGKPRPVLGVFIGWRGLSDFGPGRRLVAAALPATRAEASRQQQPAASAPRGRYDQCDGPPRPPRRLFGVA